MREHREEIIRLMREAQGLPNGSVKTALLEEAVRLADAADDEEYGYDARMDLMFSATYSGRPDIVLVAYAWCLARFDRSPETYDPHGLLWNYKWVLMAIPSFPSITRPQVEQLLGDMAQRYCAFGAPHAVATMGRYCNLWTGRLDEARAHHEQLAGIPRDTLSDCHACVISEDVEYFAETRDWKKVKEVLDSRRTARLSCHSEPHRRNARGLKAAVWYGNVPQAQAMHKQLLGVVERDPGYVQDLGRHLEYMALTNQAAAARRIVQRRFEMGFAAVDQLAKHDFLSGAYLVLERSRRDGTKSMKLTMAQPLDVESTAKGYDVAALAAWLLAEAQQIGDRFDARNGNTFFRDRLSQRVADLDTAIERGYAIE